MTKEIDIPILARVEGEGALSLRIVADKISSLQLRIYEPPRLFEKFLEGREPNEVIDAVARICGICPVAYQMSAVHALESIFNMQPGPWVRAMRRLFYCGEWIESHALHIHMLAAPDFFGCTSAMELAKDHPELVKRGMRLHTLGMELMSLLGKRSVHPVGACVGGFYAAPQPAAVQALLQRLIDHLPLAEALVKWATTLPFPDDHQTFTAVALHHPDEYPMNEGRIISSQGLDIAIEQFENYFQENQAPYSTALHCQLQGRNYLVGPLARVNLNYAQLPAAIQQLLDQTPLQFPSQNMFHSIVARSVEIYYAMLEAIRIMQDYTYPAHPFVHLTPQAGVGYGCTEAPRGLLWHRYECDAAGLITATKIVPPTSQNQGRIEEDLRHSLENIGLHHTDDILRQRSEMIIRNYDPCISCSTHFLTLQVER